MNRVLLFVGILLSVSFLNVSCKDAATGLLPAITGGNNELMVIMESDMWKSKVGDTIRSFFGRTKEGLPQEEPIFDIVSLPSSFFKDNIKLHRNLLIVRISHSIDSASIKYQDSPWAKQQKCYVLSAKDKESFYTLFDANKDLIMKGFLKAEQDRQISVLKKRVEVDCYNFFLKKYNIKIYFPAGYRLNKDTTDNFAWLSYETEHDSRGVIFFQEDYQSESQFNHRVILDKLSDMLQKYIPGPRDSTWMSLNTMVPYSVANYQYDGKYYAMMFKGLWRVENDFMGGPYVLNVVLDTELNRVLYFMGYVYAPESNKRNMMTQTEAILASMQINWDGEKETTSDKKDE